MVPWFGWALACKPNAGLPVFAASRSNRDAIIGLSVAGGLTLIAFALQPGWVADWLSAIRGQPHFKPYILRPGGLLMLLALLRWRRPEARWLVVTACVPGTPGIQEAIVFLTWPMSFRQLLVLGLLSHGALWVGVMARQRGDFYSYVGAAAIANLIFLYLPALFLVLRRPNEGELPRALDRLLRPVLGRFGRSSANPPR
jgi:hypothetical protein